MVKWFIVGAALAATIAASANAQTPGQSTALEGAHVFKASSGYLWSGFVYASSVAGFLIVLDSATDPGNGTVAPTICLPVAAGAVQGFDFGIGLAPKYANGITFVFSTAGCFTETKSTTAFFYARTQ